MGFIELVLLALGLAMDAFAVAICLGLSQGRIRVGTILEAGLFFGGFQALMPLLGYLLGSAFQQQIARFDHWVAFILLGGIGMHMLKEAWDGRNGGEIAQYDTSMKKMLLLAVATSVDALAVGITFAFLQVDILPAIGVIGGLTFMISACGVALGVYIGSRMKTWAEAAGGIILIGIGLKILLEHTGILVF